MDPDRLSQLPVDVFIQQITYLPFKDVMSICSANTTLRSYCSDPKYRNKWKLLIDSTFQNIYGYQDKLSEIWVKLNLERDTYNYLVYTKLIHILDPITQLIIYYHQGDMDSFNKTIYNNTQRFLALFLLGKNQLIEKYIPDESYIPFISLMKGQKVSFEDLGMMMTIMAMWGNVLGTTMLLKRGADINTDDNLALRLASERGHLDVVKLLLDRGADVHAEDDQALRWASKHGNLDVVKVLLDQGADVNARDDEALLWASEWGHLDVVKLLLDRGANVNAQGDEALLWASEWGHLDVVELLLDRGAKVNAQGD
jgi:hypothetical protein